MSSLNITNDDIMPTSFVAQQALVDLTSVRQATKTSYWTGKEGHEGWTKGTILLTQRESSGFTDSNQNNPKVFGSISGLGQSLYIQGVSAQDAITILHQLYCPFGISLDDFVPRTEGNNGSTTANQLIATAVAGGVFKIMNTGRGDICAGDEVLVRLPNPELLTPKDTIGSLSKDYNPPMDRYNLVTEKYTPVDTYRELRTIAQAGLKNHDLFEKTMKQSMAGRDDASNTRAVFTGVVGIGMLFLNTLLKNGIVTLNDARMRSAGSYSSDDITDKDSYDNLVAAGDDDAVADRVTGLIGRMMGVVGNVKDEANMLPLLQDVLPDSDQTSEGELIMKQFFRSVFADPTDAAAFSGYNNNTGVNGSLRYTDSGVFINTDTELGQIHDIQLNGFSNMLLSLLQFNANVKSWVIGTAVSSAPPGNKFGLLMSKSNPH